VAQLVTIGLGGGKFSTLAQVLQHPSHELNFLDLCNSHVTQPHALPWFHSQLFRNQYSVNVQVQLSYITEQSRRNW